MIKTLLVFLASVISTSSFYEMILENSEGKRIPVEKIKGKSVIVAIIDAKSAKSDFVAYLDSLQSARQDIQVLLLPASDLLSNAVIQNTAEIKASTGLITLKPSQVKSNSKNRGKLISWLTSVSENGHFEIDGISANSVFVVSKEGELRSVLSTGFPENALMDALQ